MRACLLALGAVLALTAGCAPRAGAAADPLVPRGCELPSAASLVLGDADLALAPGESRVLARPVAHYGPYGPRPIPERCRVRWSLEGAGAEVDAAGRLTVAPDARVGDSLRVVAETLGSTARGTLRIVAAGPNPLVGKWRQEETRECVAQQGPVGELELRRNGHVLLTYRPFESYVDLVGTYTYDPRTGRFEWKSPARRIDDRPTLRAVARVRGDTLVLEIPRDGDPVSLFGAMLYEHGCRAVFRAFGSSR